MGLISAITARFTRGLTARLTRGLTASVPAVWGRVCHVFYARVFMLTYICIVIISIGYSPLLSTQGTLLMAIHGSRQH